MNRLIRNHNKYGQVALAAMMAATTTYYPSYNVPVIRRKFTKETTTETEQKMEAARSLGVVERIKKAQEKRNRKQKMTSVNIPFQGVIIWEYIRMWEEKNGISFPIVPEDLSEGYKHGNLILYNDGSLVHHSAAGPWSPLSIMVNPEGPFPIALSDLNSHESIEDFYRWCDNP